MYAFNVYAHTHTLFLSFEVFKEPCPDFGSKLLLVKSNIQVTNRLSRIVRTRRVAAVVPLSTITTKEKQVEQNIKKGFVCVCNALFLVIKNKARLLFLRVRENLCAHKNIHRKCSGCHKEIVSGNYLGCMGTFFHPECFLCRACGFPITEYEVHSCPCCCFHFSNTQPLCQI